jgi:fluoroacetyl-CoA thioesterase
MVDVLRVGLIGESVAEVTPEHTALVVGSGSLEVFSTPSLVALLESAACGALDGVMSDGTTSVGIEMQVKHLSATPVGERVVSMAEVTRIEGRRIVLEVRAWDEHELIGTGTHVRYIIDAQSFMERLHSKNDAKEVNELVADESATSTD